MPRFGKKKSYTEYLYARPTLFILGIVVVLLSYAVFQRFTIEREMAQRRAEIEAQKEELLERKAQLEDKVEYLEGERGIEEEIRKHFDVAREGETVVILMGEDTTSSEETKVVEEQKTPWYIFWR